MFHQLKIDGEWFVMKVSGTKKWEIRKEDRGFKVGDILGLNETIEGKETGRCLIEEIVAVVDNAPGLREGFVLLSTVPLYLSRMRFCNDVLQPPYGTCNRE